MGKYTRFERQEMKRRGDIHPLWRGVGCIMMVVVPLISYAIAVGVVKYGIEHYWPFPASFLGHIQFPQWAWNVTFIRNLISPIANIENLGAVAVITIAFIIILGGIFSTIYAAVYRVVGPPRYTQIDAPPSKYKPKHYKR
jgi:hypothetical protein